MNHIKMKKLYRSISNRNITGVCAGISNYINVDVSVIRFIFIVLFLFNITTLLIYIFATTIIPVNPDEVEYDQIKDDQAINIKLYVASMSLIFIGLLIIAKYLEIPFFFNLWNIPLLLSLGILILFIGFALVILLRYLKTIENEDINIKRIKSNQMISGVFSGISKKINIDVTVIRIVIVTFCLLFFKTIPLAIIIYSLAAIYLDYEN